MTSQLAAQEQAKFHARQWISANLGSTTARSLKANDVFVVWFAKTLQNWKAIVATKLPANLLFEVTYNGDKHETYLDIYKKLGNVCIPDEDYLSMLNIEAAVRGADSISPQPKGLDGS